ncbi:uncharacterized protein EURHEDRAFT_411023 [Aspergillus ruber CBS 135680]|uniref:Uncharacterized protein n=1 Tax=Aspergillus ruber (strain CBS 135680) TaxID=1388766 RepID=A0A017SJN5_ASPRC|nr:uncharacterized protein EURHEDRAFT_411023 [Aspergillus ruber CBS 135680]EYE96515.1 hypothetical protein EURHEDRAFT_411023 [Aspergillus ruber CBS 135680]
MVIVSNHIDKSTFMILWISFLSADLGMPITCIAAWDYHSINYHCMGVNSMSI